VSIPIIGMYYILFTYYVVLIAIHSGHNDAAKRDCPLTVVGTVRPVHGTVNALP